ncbi:MAG TPA: SRPBCC family protein [Caulobacteraceae bacterium]|jgi:uncharacterized protein YndB with AHSA1/START domain|nr:SRPBCC family protein [Caulobacteraceae bacterium]
MLTFLVAVVVVLGVLALLIATRPAAFRIERSVRIAAAPETIYPLIADFHRWRSWSPFEDLDPALKRDYSGAASGQGAVYAWAGDNKAGTGRMEILEANAPSKVVIALHFLKPFEARNTAEFTVEPAGDGSQVTWAMYGPNSPMAKVMSLFMSMDRMVGGMFATGLAKMKAVAEG